MNKKLIRLTEGDLHRIVKESVNRILEENYSIAEEQFRESDFAEKLYNEFGIEDVSIDENGKITVWDYLTDKTYEAKADYDVVSYGLGYPSQGNPYSEAEGQEVEYYFDDAFNDICQQIKMDRGI